MLLTMAGVTGKDLRRQFVLGFLFLSASAMLLYTVRISHRDQFRALSLLITAYSLMAAGLQQYLVRRRLRRAALLVRPWPVRLGEDVEVKFRATLRESSAISFVAAKLECIEEVMIGSGRDRRKEYATLYAIDLRCIARPAGDRKVTESWTVTVPDALPPSLAVVHNIVRWQVSTLVTTDDVDVPASFELLVLPEAVRD